jgi:capsular polysaccharide biosynthesis protein
MTVTDVLRAVRARWLLFVLCCLVPVAAAIAVVRATAPVYQSTAELFVAPTGATTAPAAYQGALLAQQQAPSYARLANSPAVLTAVIADLHLTMSAPQLATQVSAASPTGSVVIDVTARAGTGDSARAIANDVAARLPAVAQRIAVPNARGRVPVKVTLVQPAALPPGPISPRKATNLAVGLVVGLAIAFSAVILREKADGRVRTVQQAQSSAGCSLVTVVEDAHTRSESRASGTGRDWAVPESFRRLRVRLAPAMAAGQARNLAVTSIEPGDPGPAVATDLALALADSGSTVALVDTDLSSPGIAGYLGIDRSPGVTEVVSGNTPVEIAAYRFNKRLLVFPVGASGTVSRQAVSQAQLGDLLRQLEHAVHYVVVHVGPVIANADGADLCSEADTAVLVVRKDRARQQHLRLAMEILRSAGADVAGVVLVPARLNLAAPVIQAAGPAHSVRASAERRASTAEWRAPGRTVVPGAAQFAVPHLPDSNDP